MGFVKDRMLGLEQGHRGVFLGDALASDGEGKGGDGSFEGSPPLRNSVLDDQCSTLGDVVPEALCVELKGGVGVESADTHKDAAKAR